MTIKHQGRKNLKIEDLNYGDKIINTKLQYTAEFSILKKVQLIKVQNLIHEERTHYTVFIKDREH